MQWYVILLFGLVVLVTHFIEGITGFGCTVLALPFAIMLVGIETAVPVLIVLGLLLCLYVVIIGRKEIVWKEYLKILLFVGLGLPIGIILFTYFEERTLKAILGIFMIIVSIRGLYVCIAKNKMQIKLPNWLLNFFLFLGGCFHGAFSSGGPLVVIYATRALKNKSNFRSTICMLWVTLNTVLLIQNTLRGVMSGDVLTLLLYSLPFLIAGALLGNYAHHNIKDKYFSTLVYVILFVSGIFMF